MVLLKKRILKFIKNCYLATPRSIRGPITRHKFKVDIDFLENEGITLKVAENLNELMQAYKLIQESYIDAKLLNNPTSNLRITKYNLLPSTTVYIAVKDNKVIGTVSQIMDTALGLPIDKMVDISDIRARGKRISEISGLAIAKEWRSRMTGLFVPLTVYCYKHITEVIGSNYIVIATNQRAKAVYEDLFLFSPLQEETLEYKEVNDKNAMAHIKYLDVEYNDFKSIYKNIQISKNVYWMLAKSPWKDFHSDTFINKFLINSPLHDLNVLEVFFATNKELIKDLSEDDKQNLYDLYRFKGEVIDLKTNIHKIRAMRKFPRYYANMNAYVFSLNDMRKTKCIEISRGGFCVERFDDLDVDRINIEIDYGVFCSLPVKRVWETEHRVGFKITHECPTWNLYMDQFQEKLILSS